MRGGPQIAFGLSLVVCVGAIAYAHIAQVEDKRRMHEGVLRDRVARLRELEDLGAFRCSGAAPRVRRLVERFGLCFRVCLAFRTAFWAQQGPSSWH